MFKLPQLPYSYDALEPYIDRETMEIHYTKHHQAYVDNLNAAIEKHPEFQNIKLEDLLLDLSRVPEDIRTAVRNNGGGHENHSMFWKIMAKNGGGTPDGKLLSEIVSVWGSFGEFKKEFSLAAKKVFGSGWAWLSLDKSGKPVIVTTANQDNPLSQGMKPVFGLDVWEHAYYLKYQNKRVDYIEAWWNVANWSYIQELFDNSF